MSHNSYIFNFEIDTMWRAMCVFYFEVEWNDLEKK